MDLGQVVVRRLDHLLEGGDRLLVAAFDQQALSGVAPPAIGVRKVFHQFLEGGVLQFGLRFVAPLRLVDDPVDAAHPDRHLQFPFQDVGLQVETGHVHLVLQNAAVEVDHVDAAVGPVVYADGAKALVGGAKKLALLEVLVRKELVGASAEALLRFLEPVTGHRIGGRLRDEGCPGIPFGIAVGAVHSGAGYRGDPCEAAVLAQHLWLVASVDPGVGPDRVDVRGAHRWIGKGPGCPVIHVPVAVQVARIAGGVEPPVIILTNAPLTAEARVARDQAAVAKDEALGALGVVHPVVEAGHEAVVGVLDGALAGVVADLGLLVALKVAVGVLAVPDDRWFSHQHATIHHGDGPRHNKLVQEIRLLVRLAIVVGVLEHDDLAYFQLGFIGALDVRHVAAHLDHPGPSVAVPCHGHGIHHHGLGGKELQLEAGGDLESVERLVRRYRVRGTQFPLAPLRWVGQFLGECGSADKEA